MLQLIQEPKRGGFEAIEWPGASTKAGIAPTDEIPLSGTEQCIGAEPPERCRLIIRRLNEIMSNIRERSPETRRGEKFALSLTPVQLSGLSPITAGYDLRETKERRQLDAVAVLLTCSEGHRHGFVRRHHVLGTLLKLGARMMVMEVHHYQSPEPFPG